MVRLVLTASHAGALQLDNPSRPNLCFIKRFLSDGRRMKIFEEQDGCFHDEV